MPILNTSRYKAEMIFESKGPEMSIKQAYKAQRETMPVDIGAWKVGGATSPSLIAKKDSFLYAGPIDARHLHEVEHGKYLRIHSVSGSGELEVAVRLSANVAEIPSQVLSHPSFDPSCFLDRVAFCLEMPFSTFEYPGDGVLGAIVDCCAAGSLVIGPEIPWSQALEQFEVTLDGENGPFLRGSSRAFVTDLAGVLIEFFELSVEEHLPLAEGQFVVLGALSECLKIPEKAKLTFNSTLAAKGVSFEFVTIMK